MSVRGSTKFFHSLWFEVTECMIQPSGPPPSIRQSLSRCHIRRIFHLLVSNWVDLDAICWMNTIDPHYYSNTLRKSNRVRTCRCVNRHLKACGNGLYAKMRECRIEFWLKSVRNPFLRWNLKWVDVLRNIRWWFCTIPDMDFLPKLFPVNRQTLNTFEMGLFHTLVQGEVWIPCFRYSLRVAAVRQSSSCNNSLGALTINSSSVPDRIRIDEICCGILTNAVCPCVKQHPSETR